MPQTPCEHSQAGIIRFQCNRVGDPFLYSIVVKCVVLWYYMWSVKSGYSFKVSKTKSEYLHLYLKDKSGVEYGPYLIVIEAHG